MMICGWVSCQSFSTKATRITDHTSSLIDQIYTSTPEKVVKAGICLVDVSGHPGSTLPEPRNFRDFSHFNKLPFFKTHQLAIDFKD